jgi:hypothetical protein
MRSGFSAADSGSRQKALHGVDVVEIGGVYLTGDKSRAKWYAGPDKTKPGMNQGGAVVEVEVVGEIMPSGEWWSLKREVDQEIGGELYDNEKNQQKNREAVNRAKEMGYAGFQENEDPDEVVVFNPGDIKVIRAFTADRHEDELA